MTQHLATRSGVTHYILWLGGQGPQSLTFLLRGAGSSSVSVSKREKREKWPSHLSDSELEFVGTSPLRIVTPTTRSPGICARRASRTFATARSPSSSSAWKFLPPGRSTRRTFSRRSTFAALSAPPSARPH